MPIPVPALTNPPEVTRPPPRPVARWRGKRAGVLPSALRTLLTIAIPHQPFKAVNAEPSAFYYHRYEPPIESESTPNSPFINPNGRSHVFTVRSWDIRSALETMRQLGLSGGRLASR